jgi:hypothetical protein
MEQKEILEKIEELFTNQKSSGFLTHLLHAYLPLDKVKTVAEKPKGKKPMRCAITGQRLISMDEVGKIMISQMDDWDNFKKSLLLTLDANDKVTQKHPEASKKITEDQKKQLNGRVLGYTGEDTNTFLSEEAVKCLIMWVQDKIFSGNGKINWIMKKINLNKTLKPLKDSKDKETKKQIKKAHKIVNKPSKTTLGDLDALQELKKKLEDQEKNNSK